MGVVGVSEQRVAVTGVDFFGFGRGFGFVEDSQLNCFFDGQACVEESFKVRAGLSHHHVSCKIGLKVSDNHPNSIPVSRPVLHLCCLGSPPFHKVSKGFFGFHLG